MRRKDERMEGGVIIPPSHTQRDGQMDRDEEGGREEEKEEDRQALSHFKQR